MPKPMLVRKNRRMPSFHGPDFEIVETTKVGERGQVVIPLVVRKRLGLKVGDKLVVLANPRMVCMTKASSMQSFIKRLGRELGLN